MMEVKGLLNQVSGISKKYEEIAEITGENFNIFKILKMETKEVKMHSAFLTALFDAEGSHSCKDVFAKIFIDQQIEKQQDYPLFAEKLSLFQTKKSNAKAEQHISCINEIGTEGGRIDILFKDINRNFILIENKIYAGEQNNWLIRYSNAYPNAPIFYLTLNGKSVDSINVEQLVYGNEYVCISYQEDILTWLEACKEKSVSYPLLRESIMQYINLIKYLTNQTINSKMRNEIVASMLLNTASVVASFEIEGNMHEMKKQLFLKFAEKLKNDFESNNPHQFAIECNVESIGNDEVTFSFVNQNYGDQLHIIFDKFTTRVIGIVNSENQNNKAFYRASLEGLSIGNFENWPDSWVYARRYSRLKNFFLSKEGWILIADNDFGIVDEIIPVINLMLSAIVNVNAIQA